MVYAPGTLETDPKKQNMALQQQATKIAALEAAGKVTSVATAGLATGGPITSTGTVTVTAAVQSDMETGTSTSVAVVPGVQKSHPLHPKAWAYITQSAGTYTLAASSGVSGISKAATGRVDITLSTAFSSTNYSGIGMANEGGNFVVSEVLSSRSATNFRVNVRSGATGTDTDAGFSIMFFGDQ